MTYVNAAINRATHFLMSLLFLQHAGVAMPRSTPFATASYDPQPFKTRGLRVFFEVVSAGKRLVYC